MLDRLPSLYYHFLVLKKTDLLQLDHRLHDQRGHLQIFIVLESPHKLVYDLHVQKLFANVFLNVCFAESQQNRGLQTSSVCVSLGMTFVEATLPKALFDFDFDGVSFRNGQ